MSLDAIPTRSRQAVLNDELNATIYAMVKTYPKTTIAEIWRALEDAKTDAEDTRREALK